MESSRRTANRSTLTAFPSRCFQLRDARPSGPLFPQCPDGEKETLESWVANITVCPEGQTGRTLARPKVMRGTHDTGARDGVPRLRGIQEITDAKAPARPLATLVMNTASVVDRDHGSRPEAQDPVTDRKSLYNGHAPTAGSAPIATLLVPAPLCAATSGSGVLARAPGAGGDSLLGRGQASLTGGIRDVWPVGWRWCEANRSPLVTYPSRCRQARCGGREERRCRSRWRCVRSLRSVCPVRRLRPARRGSSAPRGPRSAAELGAPSTGRAFPTAPGRADSLSGSCRLGDPATSAPAEPGRSLATPLSLA